MSSDGPAPDNDATTWWLEDGETVAAAHPRSFFIPPADHRADVRTGESVRLSFATGPRRGPAEQPDASEQLWVAVTAVHRDGSYRGRVEDDIANIPDLRDGDEVDFEPRHVVAIAYDPDALGYDPTDWAVIDARITEEDEAPQALTFAELSDSDDGKRHWFAALDQQPPEESAWIQLGELTDRWPEIAVVFQAGGGMWRRERSGGTYVRV